jgi:CheY-like chemotaxis protein
LQQVFWNLVKNAVKFTPPGGTIAIRSRDEAGADGMRLVIEVADNGIGIEPHALPKIFHAFEQGEGAIRRRCGGLGLGLAIGRSVVEAHGGRLIAASPGRDRGSTFTLALPTAPAPALEVPDPPTVPGGTPRHRARKILLVEDDATALSLMAEVLRRLGYFVTPVNRLAEAMVATASEDFDLVISDIGLPDGDGLDLMRRVGAQQAVKGIAITGYGTDDDRRKSREAGFVAHLTKPVDFAELEATIDQVAASIERDESRLSPPDRFGWGRFAPGPT